MFWNASSPHLNLLQAICRVSFPVYLDFLLTSTAPSIILVDDIKCVRKINLCPCKSMWFRGEKKNQRKKARHYKCWKLGFDLLILMIPYWNRLPKELAESPSLETFMRCADVELRDVVITGLGNVRWCLDLMLNVFSNLNDDYSSMSSCIIFFIALSSFLQLWPIIAPTLPVCT